MTTKSQEPPPPIGEAPTYQTGSSIVTLSNENRLPLGRDSQHMTDGSPCQGRVRSKKHIRGVMLFKDELAEAVLALSLEAFRAFVLLQVPLLEYGGSLPDEPKYLARLAHTTPRKWKSIRGELLSSMQFEIHDGRLHYHRATARVDYRRRQSEVQRARVNKRWHPEVVK